MIMIYQVPKEVYNDFVGYLKKVCISFFKLNDFTPVGEWCLVKAIAPTNEELNAANDYLDILLARIYNRDFGRI